MYQLITLLFIVILVPAVLAGYIIGGEFILQRLARGPAQARIRPWLWVGPALLLVAFMLIYPSLDTIRISFFNRPGTGFVGLANYGDVLDDRAVLIAVRDNLMWIILYTALVLLFGLALAVLADRVRYEQLVKSLIFMPMAVSFVAMGVIWKFVYSYQPPGAPQTGTLNAAVSGLLHTDPIAWLIDGRFNNFALIFVAVWGWTGFAMVILSASLKGIPAELLEAARVDGAGELTIFRRVIFPLMLPTVTVVGTTLVIFALKAFDIVYVMTGGNYDTEVLANRMYKEMFTNTNNARASAVAVVLLLAVIPVLIFNLRRLREETAR